MPRHLRILAIAVLLGLAGCSTATATSTSPSAGRATAVNPTDGMGMSMSTATTSAAPSAASTLVDPAKFAAAIDTPGTVTIDVHVPFEGKIAGTDEMIPYDEIAQQASKLPADRTVELAVYCRSGSMSAIAVTTLASLGYHHIVELQGGMQAWQSAGRTLLSTP